jgi:hypothetical protein
MSGSTVLSRVSDTAILAPREARTRATPPARLSPTPGSAPTPLFTRHMLGAIEADRDHRRVYRETHPRLRGRTSGMAHPRIADAIAARASGAER